MKIYHSLDEFKRLDKAVVTTGTFDGVHMGHQKILGRLLDLAAENNGESVLLTFFPHPRTVLQKGVDLKMITTLEERIELLEQAGLDHLIIHPFSVEFSRLTSLEFVRNILVNQIGCKKLVIGYDHHFGRNREGTFEHLLEYGPIYGFDVEEIPALDVKDVAVSSTKIRKALEEGDMARVNTYLGHRYSFRGKVVEGEQIGRKLGFPTANMKLSESYKMLPRMGAYAVNVMVNGQAYRGMLNIGRRPTVGGVKFTVEVHLFDFSETLYGENVEVFPVAFLRDEQAFDSVDQLREQLSKDAAKSRALLQAD